MKQYLTIVKKNILFLLLCLIFQSTVFPRDNERIVELEFKIERETAQDQLTEDYLELSSLYEDKNIDKAIDYAIAAYEVANNIHFTTKKIEALHQWGSLLLHKKDYQKALKLFNQALKISQETLNQKNIALSYIYIGNLFQELHKKEQALTYYKKALKIADKIKSEWLKAKTNTAIAELYLTFGKHQKALKYYLNALGNILQTEQTYLQGEAYKNVADVYKKIGASKKSTEYYKSAIIKLKQKGEHHRKLTEVYFSLADNYFRSKNYNKAIEYYKKSLGSAELSEYHNYIKKSYKQLAKAYELNGDYKNAYDYFKYYSAIKDTKVISELEAQIELEKKNREIALINQQNEFRVEAERNRTYIILSIAILTLIFTIVLYYNLRQKNKINKELKKATQLANKSKKEKEDFFAYTSHEIRTPLNAVVGMAQLLGQTKLNDTQTKYLKTIEYSAKNILFLVNDVLDLAKLEKGAITLEKTTISLPNITNEVVYALSFKTQNKPVKLLSKIDNKIDENLIGDPLRINQILLNLTDNAIKFTERGEVNINLTLTNEDKKTQTILFEVADTGIGISPDKINKIFKSYEQASVDTARRYGGTGLGLAITKQLIELMGSEIKIKSQQGKGTTFYFTITFPKPDDKRKNTAQTVQSLSNVSILAVDDTELNLSIFYDLVHSEEQNVSVDLAENGAKAIELSKTKKYDIILMDLQMPVLNGFETTLKIRKDQQNPNSQTPIIAMTAHAIEGISKRCDEVGMNDYIAKPININQLYSKIRKQLPDLFSSEKQPSTQPANPKKTENINLTALSELVGNKPQKILKYINLFLENVPKDFENLKQTIESKNWGEAAKIAHKIKGNASYMGAEKTKEILITVEKIKDDVAIFDENNDIVDQLEKSLNKVYSDLKKLKL